MTDIVERLLEWTEYQNGPLLVSKPSEGFGIRVKAAEEITRLRAENQILRLAMNEIYNEFIENEGFTMETLLEDDLWHTIKRMGRIAAKYKKTP